jgi:hypothetical protein
LRIDARRLRAVTGPPVKMLDCCLRIDANVFEFVCEAAGFVPTPSTPDFRDGARQVHEARGEARAEGQSRTWGSDCDYRRDCMRELRLAFDYILIDCPALHSAADVFSLSPLVDGIVLVVEAGKTRRDQVLQAERSIGFARGKLIGQILNKRTFIVPHWLYKRL